ncbi:hypothetical protein NliqN6_0605 [Naganishia liquefaciens]|uniref:Uncharacterized protein n=1 Tax=Naganishia liquefaciens TaxID=104408 RepID=A0A8H3YCH8_9TREE|nr:hypothetical protein NliqN6_0605 [Naganishia liquefaciens]
MISFNGAPLFSTYQKSYKPTRISHCRTPSLSSAISSGISSTEEEAQTDSLSESCPARTTKIASIVTSEPESEVHIELVYEPKTPLPRTMTPTTPTDHFTKLSVSSRRAKGESFVHRRHRSVVGARKDTKTTGPMHGGSSRASKIDETNTSSSTDIILSNDFPPPTSSAHTLVDRPTKTSSAPEARHQPYCFKPCPVLNRHQSGTPAPRLAAGSVPPAVKSKFQNDEGKQWLLVGPEIARHLQMGGSVLVRDYVGNAVGWMS